MRLSPSLLRPTCARLFALVTLFSLLEIQVYAQHKPYQPTPSGTTTTLLGSYLEGPFEVAQGQCIHQNPDPATLTIKKGWFSHEELSAIPPQLFDPSLHLDGNVVVTDDESVGRAFAGIYQTKSILSGDTNPNNFLIADYLQDPATMAASGFAGAVYDYNCTASFAASLTVNSGWKFPMADVSAGLQADATGQTAYHMAIVSGRLQSPIWAFYTSTIAEDQKTYAALLMWDWYLRHPSATRDSVNRYLLEFFNGVSLFRVATHTNSNMGTINASAAFAIPAVNIKTALEASYKNSARAEVTSFGLAIRKNGNDEDDAFQEFPRPGRIADQIADSAQAHLVLDSTDHRIKTVNMDHRQVINGVPQIVCSRPWHTVLTDGASLTGSLSVKSTKFLDPADSSIASRVPPITLPSCEITVTYSLGGAALPNRVDLNYFLATDMPDSASPPVVVATAKFKAETVTLSASGLPSIGTTTSTGQVDSGFPQVTPAPSPINHFFKYQWTLQYPVTEDTASADVKISQVDATAQNQLTCNNNRKIPVDISVDYPLPPSDSRKGTLTLTVSHSSNDQAEPLDPSQLEFCSLNEDVTFTLQGGGTFPGKVSGPQLLYPKAAQSQTNPHPGGSGNTQPPPPQNPVVVQPQ